jgi:hypothetical protein
VNVLQRQQTAHRVSLNTWRASAGASAKRKLQDARNRAGTKFTANTSEAWKVRAITYLKEHLADGRGLSRRVGRIVHERPTAPPELIAAINLDGAGSDTNIDNGGVARYLDSLGLFKSRLNDYLSEPLGIVVFEHFLARASNAVAGFHKRLLLCDGNDIYFVAAAANDIDEAYGLASTFHTTALCLQGIGFDDLRRSDGSFDVAAAAEHTVAVFVSAYDGEAFIGARLR